ncbi:N-acetyl-gamma-glutamyl-phosphate reductase [Paucihalobacter ruber]|uniref:N-acetyl-gamma-glutamyl-phosphate reductase n=1 Tax=Paucihalobacter ruber TaxID=2567861 RepID=A0A506PKQ0_9FLAO|nr:N-acetyl-gamma-glutamyl-phosphate reductase [Paucihalobacter ruber]TPV33885.1 N-acetyl-gamma-glutamyl-phosphate reductase [Paucihalobacter ruber]
MTQKATIGIIGAAGYTGSELLRLLVHHSNVNIAFATSRTHAGTAISDVFPDLKGDINIKFTEDFQTGADLIFLCLPHKQSNIWLETHSIPTNTKVIDLGNDFRIKNNSALGQFTYGLPEVHQEHISGSQLVANPGCFATAIQLALLPLAQAQLLNTVNTTGITGSTGAGVSLQPTTHFTWRNNNISAYKTLQHQHVEEILHTLQPLNKQRIDLHFVPWRGDFTRGIFTSSTVSIHFDINQIQELYNDFYSNNPFVHVSTQNIDLKQVVNTNKCLIHLEKVDHQLVIHSAIDNLIKGASGQAVHNMNLMFNWPVHTGLKLKASVY